MIDRESKVTEREIAVQMKENEAGKNLQEEKLKVLQSEVAQVRTNAFEQLTRDVEKERNARLQEIAAERENLTREQEELKKAQAELLTE